MSPATPTLVLALADHVHGSGQVPHLDAAVGVAGEQVASGPGAHPAGALALAHGEGGDGRAVHGLDLTYSVSNGKPWDGRQCRGINSQV